MSTELPNEWYVPPPSWLRIGVWTLLGLAAGEITAIAIGAHRVPMLVLFLVTLVALGFVAVRYGDSEMVGKWVRSRPSPKVRKAPAAPQAVPPASVAEEIAKLAKLQEDGLITEDEFAAQKAKLLDS